MVRNVNRTLDEFANGGEFNLVKTLTGLVFLFAGCASQQITMTTRPERIVFFGDPTTELGSKPKGFITLFAGIMLKALGY